MGFGTIVFFAALIAVAFLLNKARKVDWAGYFKRMPSRLVAEWRYTKENVTIGVGSIVAAILLAAVLVKFVSPHSNTTNLLGWLLVFSLVVMGVIYLFQSVLGLLEGALYDSNNRSGLDTVINQKAHGEAGHASEAAVDAALRDEPEASSPAPKFQD